MSQEDMVKRIDEICAEFDSRVEEVGINVARLELAKTLSETEEYAEDQRMRVVQMRKSFAPQPYFLDATPNDDYPIRVLRSHKYNGKWSCGTTEQELPELMKLYNQWQDERNALLDRAIRILEQAKERTDGRIRDSDRGK